MIKLFQQFNEGERYQNILKGYGKDVETLQAKRGVMPDKNTSYYEHLPSNDLAEDLLERYYKPGFKMLDIGCGLGNILKLASEIGYESYGIEVNEKLKKYHDDLNVTYGDILKLSNYSFLEKFDVIYLYRPISDNEKCDRLFEILYENCKEGCKIIYVLPSALNLNLKRKFEFELFPVFGWIKDSSGNQVRGETDKKTDRSYSRNEFFSILTPKKGVIDINVENLIDKSVKEMIKYDKTKESTFKYEGHKFECDPKDFEDFIKCLKKSTNSIIKYDLEIKYDLKFKSSKYTPETRNIKPVNLINTIKLNSEKILYRKDYPIKKVMVFMRYAKYKNTIYQYVDMFGN